MRNLYARLILFLLRPAFRLFEQQNASERARSAVGAVAFDLAKTDGHVPTALRAFYSLKRRGE